MYGSLMHTIKIAYGISRHGGNTIMPFNDIITKAKNEGWQKVSDNELIKYRHGILLRLLISRLSLSINTTVIHHSLMKGRRIMLAYPKKIFNASSIKEIP